MTGRPRRRVSQLSDVDRNLLSKGEEPSWVQPAKLISTRISEREQAAASQKAKADKNNGGNPNSNDARLLSELPPHWSPPAL